MSKNKREDIIVRLTQIAEALAGGETETTFFYRDRVAFDNHELPAFVVLDGGEEKKVGSSDKLGFNIMEVNAPFFYVAKPTENNLNEGIGPLISERCLKIIKAVKLDGELRQICGENGHVDYIRMQTDMEVGSECEGNIRVDFGCGYALIFNKL